MENHQNHKPDLEKNHDHNNSHAWGTWEELLLACAVNRHGFKDWDTVAMEVQSRTTRLLPTARHCEQKFHDLNRRFADQCNDDVPPPCQNGDAAGDNSDHVPWLHELRKLRVAELRREVQRRDVSILSLQLEVKRLEEEKAENDGKGDEKPDLAVSGKPRLENDKTGGELDEAEPAHSEPEIRRLDESTTDKMLPTTGDESDRENQSVNESNSTGSRFEKIGEGDAKLGSGPVPVHTGPKEPDPVGRKGKPVGEESNNGSYDTLAKVPTCESVPPSEERKVEEDDSSELHDSVAHSGEGGTRESSEVQSSASLTRKRKRRLRKEVSGDDDRGGEVAPENDEVAMMKSEPLIGVMEMIKGHEHSSMFERRLESQESDGYKDIVRQHVDLETIQMRLQKGHYSSCSSAFFRDLLLVFSNAIVFFPQDSIESQGARQLHRLVAAEMKNHVLAQPDPVPRKSDSLPPNAPQPKPDSLLNKHKAPGPILVCRKRSSISAKPSSATFVQKGDQGSLFTDKKEKPSSDSKPPSKPSSSDTDDDDGLKTKEKPVTGARSLRRSNKNLNNKKLPSNSTPKAGSSGSKATEIVKQEKSKAEGASDKKKNAAADFLKRIKKNTSVEASKGGGGSGGGGSSSSSRGGAGGISIKDQKKVVNQGKVDKGKERTSRHNGGGGSADKRTKNIDNNSQSKRSVGRPPKKATETSAVGAKRGRDNSANTAKDKRPKKRSKK